MEKLFFERGVDYGATGWITEKGELIECEPHDHDRIATERTGKPIKDVEKLWVRIGLIFGKNIIQFEGKKLTKAQIDTLESWGIMDFIERKRAQVSPKFIEAYFA